jgi:hypothetical protein
MDSASDFGSGGWGFESPQGLLGTTLFCRDLDSRIVVPFQSTEFMVASLAEWLRRWL